MKETYYVVKPDLHEVDGLQESQPEALEVNNFETGPKEKELLLS